jgi:SAM-dependent methyltransferase
MEKKGNAMARTARIAVPMPDWLYRTLQATKRRLSRPDSSQSPVDIGGERYVEWSFLSAEMPEGPGEALEFGCEFGYLSFLAAEKGFHVLANDLEDQFFLWRHPNVVFQAGDFLKLDYPENHFDLAINCSSVEHVGVPGRYGIKADKNDGDIEVMNKLAKILKPGGRLLMTAPCGQDAVLAPWCRVYGEERLPRLFASYSIVKERFWIKSSHNQWVEGPRKAALNFQPRYDAVNPHRCLYALGCFVLRKES